MPISWVWGAEEKKKGDEGFNNAGILTFNSQAINSFIRELFQNSNDAKAEGEKKVKIKIEYKEVEKRDIPEFDRYLEILEHVKATHPGQTKFFRKAEEILQRDRIPFLIYSDFNTKGLSGTEGDTYSSFVACVLSEGISAQKGNNAGGSYGIGKNAIYGISALRTVFYSSVDSDDIPIFQGVAKLASYKIAEKNHEGRIYLGHGPERLSVRDFDSIPGLFKRSERGLSQFVMGVELDDSWEAEFARAILRNYWLLLINDGLDVEILKNGKRLLEINKGNCPALLAELFNREQDDSNINPTGSPLLFYEAYTKGIKREFDIPVIGKCAFYYFESESGENNIAYLRNGMVIYSRIEKRLVGANVTGVFICETEEGNAVLRKMEPPKHDSFEPQMLEDNHENYSKKDGEKILFSIKSHIRSVIKELIQKFKEEIETPVFLTELFEELQRAAEGAQKGERKNEASPYETIYRRAREEEISVLMNSDSESEYVSSLNGDSEGAGSGESEGSGPSGKQKSKKKGGQSRSGGAASGGRSPKYPIQTRVFLSSREGDHNVYKCVIHSEQDIDAAELILVQAADSGEDVAFRCRSVRDSNGSSIPFITKTDQNEFVINYMVTFHLKVGKNIFFFEIEESEKSAFILKG